MTTEIHLQRNQANMLSIKLREICSVGANTAGKRRSVKNAMTVNQRKACASIVKPAEGRSRDLAETETAKYPRRNVLMKNKSWLIWVFAGIAAIMVMCFWGKHSIDSTMIKVRKFDPRSEEGSKWVQK